MPPHPEPGREDAPAASGAAAAAVEFHYAQSDSFGPLLRQLGVSLLVTTYQANKLLVVRATQGGLSLLVRTFEKPMGLAVDARRLA
ncbi:MAG TPA: TIGR03032 family protein, partial [Planctomycetales bacterium]|nr:TIGR03032 family protein [Planctomycetales bacterium]